MIRRSGVSALLAVLGLALGPSIASGQATVLRAARMIDVESGSVVQDAVVVVVDGRITRVGGAAPRGGEVIDLGDATLLPGLTDLHTHLSSDLTGDWTNRAVRETESDAVLRAAYHAKKTLMAGFTTVRDMSGFPGVALQHAIERGFVDGPRIVPGANTIGITGGHCDVTGFRPGILETGPEDGIGDGPGGVLRAVRYQIKHGAKFIKICATAGVLSFEGPVGAQQLSYEEMRTIIEEADRHGIHVAAHAHGAQGIYEAVRAGITTIEHGSILTAESVALMKERGTYLVPTTYLAGAIDLDALPPPIRSKAEEILPQAIASVRRAIREGVRIAYGTDAGVFAHGDNGLEFPVLVERGMTPLATIQAATIVAADVLGVEDRGRIAEGAVADIIAVPGNPLEDIDAMTRVSFVMKDGIVYKR